MDAIEILRNAAGTPFKTEDRKSSVVHLSEPLSDDEIAQLSRELESPLPTELEKLLRFTQGFDSALGYIALISTDKLCEDWFPHNVTLAPDGCGNFWLADLTGSAAEEAVVFFACHDPPVFVVQAQSITNFIADVIAYGTDRENSPIERVMRDTVHELWQTDTRLLTYKDCLSGDASLKQFAQSLDDTYEFFDLRNAKVGDGFAWGKYGADTVSVRHGTEKIFARQKKKLSFFQKLFGV